MSSLVRFCLLSLGVWKGVTWASREAATGFQHGVREKPVLGGGGGVHPRGIVAPVPGSREYFGYSAISSLPSLDLFAHWTRKRVTRADGKGAPGFGARERVLDRLRIVAPLPGLVFLTIASVLSACGAPKYKQSPSPQQKYYGCPDSLSSNAIRLTQKAVPDSDSGGNILLRRSKYLSSHVWQLFDAAKTGKMTFDEYLSFEWSGLLVAAKPGTCKLTERQFLALYMGDQKDKYSGWQNHQQQAVIMMIYQNYDPSNKGYLEKNDIVAQAFSSFSHLDRAGRGYITKHELPELN
jgi:hypothetical protein